MSHSDTGFDERLAYVLWLRARGRISAETDKSIADGAGVGLEWFRKWKRRPDSPRDRQLSRKLCDYLGVTADWLLDAHGDAPEPASWAPWIERRRTEFSSPKRKKAPEMEMKPFTPRASGAGRAHGGRKGK